MRKILAILLMLTITAFLFAQEEDASFGFGFNLGLGAKHFPTDDGEFETYQNISLAPDLSFGDFGIGLDLEINFKLEGDQFIIRQEDWIPADEDGQRFADIYLPKFKYIRYGQKGDNLFIKLGTVDDAVLGNGFIIGNYSNGQFMPEKRLFGLNFDLDGKLFDIPYFGLETFAANLAVFDVMGARLFARPLASMELPIINMLEIGATVVTDRVPGQYWEATNPVPEPDSAVTVIGFDITQPIIANDVISLAAFGDYVIQNETSGGMIGFGGRLISLITYGAQIRFLGDNFIPTYFDASYDLYRPEKYAIYNSETVIIDQYVGWFATAGFSLLEDMAVFKVSIDGPIDTQNNVLAQPHMQANLFIDSSVLAGFGFEFIYDKKGIADFDEFLKWQENAYMAAKVSYEQAPAVISLVYNLRYLPNGEWEVTSGLETEVSF